MKSSKEKQLLQSILFNEEDDFARLLSEGVNVNYPGVAGRTPLYQAVFLDRVKFIKKLLANDSIKVDVEDIFGSTPLHAAASKGNKKLVKALIKKKAAFDKADTNGATPFVESVKSSHYDLAKFFLKKGANVDARIKEDSDSELHNVTSLHIASLNGDIPMIRLLVSWGANTEATSQEGYTPRELFLQSYPTKIAKFDAAVQKALEAAQESTKLKSESAGSNDGLEGDFNQHHKTPSSAAPKVMKRKQHVDHNDKFYKKYKVIKGDREEEDFNVGSMENSESSSSSSSSPDSPPGGGGIKSNSAESAPQQSTISSLHKEQSANHEQQQITLQVIDDQTDSRNADSLIMTLFTWVKDLPEVLQQQILSSFSMQQVLKLLEKTTHPDKFITSQLSNQSPEERLEAEHQKYYSQYGFISNLQDEHAQVNQYDSSVLLDKDAEVISSDGVLIDPLPKHDINFGIPHLFGSIAS